MNVEQITEASERIHEKLFGKLSDRSTQENLEEIESILSEYAAPLKSLDVKMLKRRLWITIEKDKQNTFDNREPILNEYTAPVVDENEYNRGYVDCVKGLLKKGEVNMPSHRNAVIDECKISVGLIENQYCSSDCIDLIIRLLDILEQLKKPLSTQDTDK